MPGEFSRHFPCGALPGRSWDIECQCLFISEACQRFPWRAEVLPGSMGLASNRNCPRNGDPLGVDDAAGEAHQDRSEGRHSRPIRHFPDPPAYRQWAGGRGRRASKTVPGDPEAHSTAADYPRRCRDDGENRRDSRGMRRRQGRSARIGRSVPHEGHFERCHGSTTARCRLKRAEHVLA